MFYLYFLNHLTKMEGANPIQKNMEPLFNIDFFYTKHYSRLIHT